MKLLLASCFAWVVLLGVGCIPPRLVGADGSAGSGGGGGAAAGASGTGMGGAGMGGAGIGGRLMLDVATDEDDALWLNGTDERLRYSDSDGTIEVGVDSERGRVGLRFLLALQKDAHISSATLHLRRADGIATPPSTMLVQVYDSVDVAPFNDDHMHAPADHDPRRLWGTTVSGFMVCGGADVCTSPDISKLVQRIVERSEWTGTGHIGFVISPDPATFTPDGWVAFQDSCCGEPASLEVEYGPPP